MLFYIKKGAGLPEWTPRRARFFPGAAISGLGLQVAWGVARGWTC